MKNLSLLSLLSLLSEAQILVNMKRLWEKNFQFYSRKGQEERERWVVSEFLDCLSIPFLSQELRSLEQRSKVDVEFREGKFQIKEIPDPNLRRNDEIKTIYRRVMKAENLQEITGPGFVYDVPPVISGYELVKDKARCLAFSRNYEEHKASLDLLFYITRTMVSVIEPCEIQHEELSSLGWRSISCLMGNHALVLYASHDAPAFLRVINPN